eukprot:CAMPEP_0184859230 /NCGR_PEP_ID=MMETSP0580-20130426/4234_1 /TAXON_ID=1118495 /ORGANISM="Dactyliosolen fragilissimus" /LENGTH=60 /DNA_ID=CAMNT_0027355735 /DNA_START=75 /DNA_END=257 /DNA_ORIENTATION=-
MAASSCSSWGATSTPSSSASDRQRGGSGDYPFASKPDLGGVESPLPLTRVIVLDAAATGT